MSNLRLSYLQKVGDICTGHPPTQKSGGGGDTSPIPPGLRQWYTYVNDWDYSFLFYSIWLLIKACTEQGALPRNPDGYSEDDTVITSRGLNFRRNCYLLLQDRHTAHMI